MKIYEFKYKYQIEKNYKDGFDYESIKELWTDYFDDYDFILGDWSYGKLRLKGYCNKKINDYNQIEDYIKKNCAYDCRYFVLKKIEE